MRSSKPSTKTIKGDECEEEVTSLFPGLIAMFLSFYCFPNGSNYYVVFWSNSEKEMYSEKYALKRGNTTVITSPRLRNSFRRTVTYRRSVGLCSSRLVIPFNCGFLLARHSQFMFLKMRSASHYQQRPYY